MKLHRGYELWRGPSRLDDAPITVLVKAAAANVKTGPMATLYVLRQDISPVDAVRTGRDKSVCGHCPMRKALGGECYVDVEKAPTRVWRAWRRGAYPQWPGSIEQFGLGLHLRMSAYGDIDALPRSLPETLSSAAAAHTAYTEGWRGAPPSWRRWCMASVHSATDAGEARAAGWRTYRDKHAAEPLLPGELECEYQRSRRRKRCVDCRLCGAAGIHSVVIDRH